MSRRITRLGETYPDDDVVEIGSFDEPDVILTSDDVVVGAQEELSLSSVSSNCPRCGKPLIHAIAISGDESPFFLECPDCGTLVNTFKPLPHQVDFLTHPARFKMAAGG